MSLFQMIMKVISNLQKKNIVLEFRKQKRKWGWMNIIFILSNDS